MRPRCGTRKDDVVRLKHMRDAAREAAGRISDDVRVAVPAIPWVDVIGMRNRLVHVYFDIDLDRLWDTVQQDLPPLAEELERTLAGLDSSSPPDASQR